MQQFYEVLSFGALVIAFYSRSSTLSSAYILVCMYMNESDVKGTIVLFLYIFTFSLFAFISSCGLLVLLTQQTSDIIVGVSCVRLHHGGCTELSL